jgi:hypothetical protein
LNGSDGAISRIQKEGFIVGEGPAHSFDIQTIPFSAPLKGLTILGSVAMIVIMLSYFVPSLRLFLFAVGAVGALGLFVISPNGISKLLALGAGTAAPTVAMMLAIQRLRRRKALALESSFGFIVNLFVRTTFISLLGAVFVVGLLNHVTYIYLLDQFTGVKLLGLLPLLLLAVYVLFFSEGLNGAQMKDKARRILTSYISVLWIILAAIVLGGAYYYMSRTGNEGQVSPFEMVFRSFLENTLGVRPRNKEFLIGHPLFLLGAYLCVKRGMSALYIFIIGVIGQVDMVGTFTHLHTPVLISLIRIAYGMFFGAVIGFLLILVWEICTRGWKRWAVPSRG